jgi:hypothetical protein
MKSRFVIQARDKIINRDSASRIFGGIPFKGAGQMLKKQKNFSIILLYIYI